MDRNCPVALLLALALGACSAPSGASPDPASEQVAADLAIGFGRVAFLEAVGPDGWAVPYEDGSRAVVVNFDLTNQSDRVIAVEDFPAVQLFDPDEGAWSPDMVFVPGPEGEFTNDRPRDLQPGARLAAAAIFTIPGRDWDRAGWTAGWRGSTAVDRTPVP